MAHQSLNPSGRRGGNLISSEVWDRREGRNERRRLFNCYLWDSALTVDLCPASAFIRMHFSSHKTILGTCWRAHRLLLLTHRLSFSLSPLIPPFTANLPRPVWHRWLNPADVLSAWASLELPILSSHLLVSPAAEWIQAGELMRRFASVQSCLLLIVFSSKQKLPEMWKLLQTDLKPRQSSLLHRHADPGRNSPSWQRLN